MHQFTLDPPSLKIIDAHLDTCFPELRRPGQPALPPIVVSGGWLAWYLTWVARADGITFGRYIFLRPRIFRQFLATGRVLDTLGPLVVHEATHVWQYRRDGILPFLVTYVGAYLRNLTRSGLWWVLSAHTRHQAYLAIPYEVQARHAEAMWHVFHPPT